ncbi:MAG: flagellar hook-length control protein FliK, partial [Rhizomicrobium sp.]
ADVNKADAASPFALLMEVGKGPAKTTKKDIKDSGDTSVGAKSPVKQKDGKQNDGKQNDAKQNDVRQNDNAAAAQSASQPRPAASAKIDKTDKSDKNKDAGAVETAKDAAEDKQVASVEQQAADAQAPPPLVTQAPVAVSAITDTSADAGAEKDIRIDAAAPIAPNTDTPDFDPAAAPPAPATDQTAPSAQQTQIAAQPGQADDTETTDAAAAQSVAAPPTDAKPPVTAKDTAKPVKTAAKSEAAATAKSDTTGIDPAKDDLEQADSAKAGDETVPQAKTAKTDIAKNDSAEGASPESASLKGHAAHDNVASNAKADNGASDGQKADAPQADVRPVDSDNTAPAATKPVPQSASQSNAAFAINTIAAPQAVLNSQAPIATQHVQVSERAAPNLPALAVEIVAKSQSGAKQFDIRLDPPELGRVDVRLSIDATGKASAHLSADQPQTLHLLQKDAPMLTRALREAGLDVSQDGLNFSLRQQGQGQQGNDGNNGRFAGARTFSLAATASIDPAATAIAYRGLADGRVDIRV